MKTYEVQGSVMRTIILAITAENAQEAVAKFEERTSLDASVVGRRWVLGNDEGTGKAILEGDEYDSDSEGVMFNSKHVWQADEEGLTRDQTPDKELATFLFLRAVENEMARAQVLFPSNAGNGLAMIEEIGEFAVELLAHNSEARNHGTEIDDARGVEGIQAAAMILQVLVHGWPPLGKHGFDENLLLAKLVGLGNEARALLEQERQGTDKSQISVKVDFDDSKIDQLKKALSGATSALRSYQYGNSAPNLAADTADFGEALLARIEATPEVHHG